MKWSERASEVLRLEANALLEACKFVNDDFDSVVDLILNCSSHSRVVVVGVGKSGHIGNKIAATLASTGTPAFYMHPGEAGHGDLGMVTSHDVVIALSHSGSSEEILRLIPYFKRNKVRLIAFTGVPSSPLALHADYIVNTSVAREACPLDLAPTASTTLALAMGDALAICLLEARGFSSEDFAKTHPFGSLGRRLLVKIEDVMSPLNECPSVTASMSMQDVLMEISSLGFGFAVVVDEQFFPVGVFTDGDLRRCLNHSVALLQSPIGDVMTREFSTIRIERLATEAVEIMEAKKISAMPVVDSSGLLVGTINMRQILQAGVV